MELVGVRRLGATSAFVPSPERIWRSGTRCPGYHTPPLLSITLHELHSSSIKFLHISNRVLLIAVTRAFDPDHRKSTHGWLKGEKMPAGPEAQVVSPFWALSTLSHRIAQEEQVTADCVITDH